MKTRTDTDEITGGRARALATFHDEAGACTRCHSRGWLHVEDARTAAPLFHLEATGRAPVLCVMEAPNRDDTFDPAKRRLTVRGQTDPTGRFLEELLTHVGLRADDVVCTNSVLCLPRYDGRRYRVTPALRNACRPCFGGGLGLIQSRRSRRSTTCPTKTTTAAGY